MDKVKKYLEEYVQWLALALGVGFLGWMVYSFVLDKPVKSQVGDNPAATPPDINSIVWNGPGQKLQAAIDSTAVPKDPIGPKSNFPEVAMQPFAEPSKVAVAFPSSFTPSSPPEIVKDTGPANDTKPGNTITRLPEAAPPTNLLISGGHSNVPAPAPPAAAGAPPVAPAGGLPPAVDRKWETVSAVFPTAALAKEFKDVGITPGTQYSNTTILRVILMRQERNADGSWPDDTVFTEIQPLEINPLLPLPPNNAPFNEQNDYLENFAKKSFIPIARPPFYQVLQGDVWYEPGTPNPNEAQTVIDDGFDPQHPLSYTGDPANLTPTEKKTLDDAKAAAAAAARRAAAQNAQPTTPPQNNNGGGNGTGGRYGGGSTGGGGGGGGGRGGGGGGGGGRGGGGGGRGMADDPQRLAADYPNPLSPQPPVYGGPGGPGYFQPPANGGQAPAAALPSGAFDPSQQPAFRVWAHDPTVQAGKTYRYKLKYVISNPIARTTGLCAKNLSDQFYIESKPSAWTDPVNVESDTNFYASSAKRGVQFDVFKWQNGLWQMQSVTANPGDMIGSVVTDATTGAQTDFTTGWTLVDMREDPTNNDNKVLVLVSENGTVLIREVLTDANNAKHRKLLNTVQAKPAVAGGPVNPNGNP